MDTLLYVMAAAFFGIRLLTVAMSRKREAALRAGGAVEHGAANTKALMVAHTAFYLAAVFEGYLRQAHFDAVSLAGLVIYLFAMLMLVWVIRLLGPFWTVKIMISPQHVVCRHPLFKIVRHPNYFLNIIPELIGFALVFHASTTLTIGLPIYLVPLIIRIRREERAMRRLL